MRSERRAAYHNPLTISDGTRDFKQRAERGALLDIAEALDYIYQALRSPSSAPCPLSSVRQS
ncbi:MAG: hypothetical protein KAX44_04065, partial [Candidatus Brocadiae bacterium]|nr:hypothetical protein [Candidatus Brocadiia bacterium]